MLPIQDPTGDLVLPVVVVGPQRPEAPADAAPEVAAEEVGKLHGFPPALHPGPAQGMGARQCGGHGEEIRTDFHAPEEERLLLLEPRAVHQHGMEKAARQTPARAIDEAHMRGKAPELAVAGPAAPSQPAGGIPACIK